MVLSLAFLGGVCWRDCVLFDGVAVGTITREVIVLLELILILIVQCTVMKKAKILFLKNNI